MMIASRNGFMVGKRLTAKSYPSMPDLCHLDGIENVGYGTHSDTPSAWVDLTGHGCNVSSFVSSSSVSSDCFISAGDGIGNISSAKSAPIRSSWANGEWTEEIVFKAETGTAAFFGQGAAAYIDRNGVFFQIQSYNLNIAIIPNYTTLNFWAGLVPAKTRMSLAVTASFTNNLIAVYLNGSLKTSRSVEVPKPALSTAVYLGTINYTPGYSSLTGEFCELRSHSRALTASEIAANYAVDKARFGLP